MIGQIGFIFTLIGKFEFIFTLIRQFEFIFTICYFPMTAKLQWQNDSLSMLDEERRNWVMAKDEEIQTRVDEERQKWTREFEQKLEEEKQSWREFELETEKLKVFRKLCT